MVQKCSTVHQGPFQECADLVQSEVLQRSRHIPDLEKTGSRLEGRTRAM